MKPIIKYQNHKISKPDSFFLVFLIMGLVFLYVFSFSTSPLTYNSWGSDSAFFQYVGFCASKGQVPYRDIFDTKGPYLFLIQQLAYTIGGSHGRYIVFLFQMVCMAASLLILDVSCRLFHPKKKSLRLLTVILFFFFLSYTIDGGNLTEEYAIPLLLFCQYLMLKTYHVMEIGSDSCLKSPCKSSENQQFHVYPASYAFVYGGCFGILALSRITNSCLIFCIVLSLLLSMLAEKQWWQIIKNMSAFLIGVIFTTIPILLWYAHHNALQDMLQAVFISGFSYATETMGKVRLNAYLPLLLLCLAAIFLAHRFSKPNRRYTLYLGICLSAHTVVLLFGKAFIHYYQLIIPPSLCALWYLSRIVVEEKKNWMKKSMFVLLSLIFLSGLVTLVAHGGRIVAAVGLNTEAVHASALGRFAEKLLLYDTSGVNYGYYTGKQAGEILSYVPSEEQNSIYSNSPTWLLLTQKLTPCRYCETPGIFMTVDREIYDEMEIKFSEGEWMYLVLETNMVDSCMKEAMNEHYQIIAQNDIYTLYKYVSL